VKVVRNCPPARALPSRRRFALTRLLAFLGFLGSSGSSVDRRGTPRNSEDPEEHIVLAIDPDQTASESYLASTWFTASLACYIAAMLPLMLPVALVVALPLAAIAIPLICMFATLPMPDRDNTRVSSAALFVLLAIASGFFALDRSWVRFVAWLFFAIVIANAIAAAIVWLLRGRVRELEARCGV
jgi:hypothetical protein